MTDIKILHVQVLTIFTHVFNHRNSTPIEDIIEINKMARIFALYSTDPKFHDQLPSIMVMFEKIKEKYEADCNECSECKETKLNIINKIDSLHV